MKEIKGLASYFLKEKVGSYRHHVGSFIEFIESQGFTNHNSISYLQGIRSEDVIRALEFYIEKKKVSSKETAFGYTTAVKEFLYYLIENKMIGNSELKNELLLPGYEEKSYRYKIYNYIDKNKKLKEKKSFEELCFKEVEDFLNQCKKLMNSDKLLEKAINQKKSFHIVRSVIITKLILLTGAPYRKIREINLTDVNIEENTIRINDFRINVPDSFMGEINKYLKIVSCVGLNSPYMFTEFNGKQISKLTSNTVTLLGNLIWRNDLSSLVKFTVREMIENEASENIILFLHSQNKMKGIIGECHSMLYPNNLVMNQHLNSKIQKSKIYSLI